MEGEESKLEVESKEEIDRTPKYELAQAYARQSLSARLAEASEFAASKGMTDDVYGRGDGRFEHDVASHIGMEAGLFCPTGIMAQLVALCAHRDGRDKVVVHATSHLVLHEQDAASVLAGFELVIAGEPDRPLRAADVDAVLDETVVAVVVECPHRELGGKATSYSDLVAIRELCDKKGAAFHCDGARLWEATPHYKCALKDLVSLFASVYVSFYKGLGAPVGAMLLGSADFIESCKPWLRRFGGNLHTSAALVVPCARGFSLYKDDFNARFNKLQDIVRDLKAARLVGPGKLILVPDEPQSAMIHIFLNAPRDKIERAADLTLAHGKILVFDKLRSRPTDPPDHYYCELKLGPNNMAIPTPNFTFGWMIFLDILQE